jgi:uncharacterized membrane protein
VNKTTLDAHVSAKELRRWVTWLGGSMIGACVFTAAALAGAGAWLIAPAIVVGPGIGGIALIWLALSSDTNAAHATGAEGPAEVAFAEPTA